MELSPQGKIYLSDFVNTMKHTAMVALSMIIAALVNYLTTGSTFDYKTLGVAIIVLFLNAFLVLVNRYINNNTNEVTK